MSPEEKKEGEEGEKNKSVRWSNKKREEGEEVTKNIHKKNAMRELMKWVQVHTKRLPNKAKHRAKARVLCVRR